MSATTKLLINNLDSLKRAALFVAASCLRVFDKLSWRHTNDDKQILSGGNSVATASKKGKVLLVGAGPGDPDLLTIKALKAIQSADVVLVDWLVNDKIKELIPSNVEQFFVGKRAGMHCLKQEQINDLLVTLALEGKQIVRLKGGDPAIFGRTAEEVNALEINDIEYAIIPGITAASGASAYSGIPLTLRGCATSVRLITAHMQNPDSEPDWTSLVKASSKETLVFYMGLGRLETIKMRLLAANIDANMPVTVIDKATTDCHQVCMGNISNIDKRVRDANFDGPSLILVGRAVSTRFKVSKTLLDDVSALAIS